MQVVDLVKEQKIAYILSENENCSLNTMYAYFSQVQLRLFLMGLDLARYCERQNRIIGNPSKEMYYIH